MMSSRLLAVIAAFFIASLVLPISNAYAFGRKSDICGSWNNYCNGAVNTNPGNRGTPGPVYRPPDLGQMAFNRAFALQQAGNLKEAEKAYLKALRYNSTLAAAYNNLANIYSEWGWFQKAEDNYLEAIKYAKSKSDINMYRDNLDILHRDRLAHEGDLGDRLLNQGDYYGAIAAYRKAWGHCGSFKNCHYFKRKIAIAKRNRESDRGNQLFSKNDWDAAIAAYNKALFFCRSDMDCSNLRDNISAAKINRENTRRNKQRAKRDHANFRGNRLSKQGDFNGAIAAFQIALDNCRSYMNCDYIRQNISIAKNKRLEREADNFRKSRKLGEAELVLRKLVSGNPGDVNYIHALGNNLLDQKNSQKAEIILRNGVKRHPDDAHMHFLLSVALRWQDRGQESEEEARKASILDTSNTNYQDWVNRLHNHNTSFMRHLDPVLNPAVRALDSVFNKVPRIVSTVNNKRKSLGKSLRDDYQSVFEQASSAEFHGLLAKGSSGETAKAQLGMVLDTKGLNVGTTLGSMTVDARMSNQAEKIPEEVRSNKEWKALESQDKKLQGKIDKKEKLLAGLHQMRSDPKISPLKKAMVLVATANVKKDMIDLEHQKNMVKAKKKLVIKRYNLGRIKVVNNDESKTETTTKK